MAEMSVEQLRRSLRKDIRKARSRRPNLRHIVSVMYDEIAELFAARQTPRSVAQGLTMRGYPISMATLEQYFRDETRRRKDGR